MKALIQIFKKLHLVKAQELSSFCFDIVQEVSPSSAKKWYHFHGLTVYYYQRGTTLLFGFFILIVFISLCRAQPNREGEGNYKSFTIVTGVRLDMKVAANNGREQGASDLAREKSTRRLLYTSTTCRRRLAGFGASAGEDAM
jgi:hypothetical protein